MLPGCYEQSASSPHPRNRTLLFTVKDKPGSLDACLKVFKDGNINLSRIQSYPSKTSKYDYDFTVQLVAGDAASDELIARLETEGGAIGAKLVSDDYSESTHATPWFPRRLSDLDAFADKTLEYGAELSADHPGFTDDEYRRRRAEITQIAKTYRTYILVLLIIYTRGMEIPRIEYTKEEVDTWRTVYTALKELYPTHACRQHQYVFPLLEQNCGYSPDTIPQLEDISRFLKQCTGFTLRPVMGLLSSRDFLNGLAFRVFHATQYVRHHSRPHYTPEPDVCHELLGHVPLFANQEFAAFSQEIGLASLGATDEDISRLATIYWFTVEFGLCYDDDGAGESGLDGEKKIKAYGAGLLSSYGELEYCLSKKPELRDFEPDETAIKAYPITEFQPVYYVAKSFKHAQEQVRAFARKLKRPFAVKYDPYTSSVLVMDTPEKLVKCLDALKSDLDCVIEGLRLIK